MLSVGRDNVLCYIELTYVTCCLNMCSCLPAGFQGAVQLDAVW